MPVATPTLQGKNERPLTNNEARREGRRGQQRTPANKPRRIPYALPKRDKDTLACLFSLYEAFTLASPTRHPSLQAL